MILPDFENLYTNRSYISRGEQVRQFRRLVEIIQEEIVDINERYMEISLHGLLYSILSETPQDETIFMAADIITIGLLAMYLEKLRPDNILVTTELDNSMDYKSEEFHRMLRDYLELLRRDMPKKFTIMIFPYIMLESDFDMWLKYINKMLAYKGRIIIYDYPDREPTTDDIFIITKHAITNNSNILMLQSKKKLEASELSISLNTRMRKLSKNIMDAIHNNNAKVHELDELIFEAWELEKDVIRCSSELYNIDIKYKISEIKNALLDLRYSDETDIDFFSQLLRDEVQDINYVI